MSGRDIFGAVVGVAMVLAILAACGWVMMHQTPVIYDIGSGLTPP